MRLSEWWHKIADRIARVGADADEARAERVMRRLRDEAGL